VHPLWGKNLEFRISDCGFRVGEIVAAFHDSKFVNTKSEFRIPKSQILTRRGCAEKKLRLGQPQAMPTLYSDILLDHFRHPRNYGNLDSPDISNEQFNPLCGDRISIEIKLKQSTVSEARFKGDACAICTAAASLLTELVLREKVGELANITDERLISALESDIKPSRLQCALLPLQALREGLKNYKAQK